MPQLRQRTIAGHTVTMHKLENPIPEVRNTPFLYEIRIDGSTDEEQFTQADADRAFEQVIQDIRRGIEVAQQDSRRGFQNGGLFGGGFF